MNSEWLWQAAQVGYLFVLAALCVYGVHRLMLVALFWRVHRRLAAAPRPFEQLPTITVQLPMYNEPLVAERVIRHVGQFDYPRDRLEIQVLDDSTDQTPEIARAAVEQLRAQGLDAHYLHRSDRVGFKAGALAAGLQSARGEFVAVFDADFVPPPDLLRRAVRWLNDPQVAMVQCRWEHLNRGDSLLTRVQAILLDGHFVVEHTVRNRTGRYMSFNGTAGIWRRSAIVDAGGWQHDTLTEDLDLSYRAQLRGWRFRFLPELTAPAELPPEIQAFRAQQHRWTKGGAQTCRKLLGQVLRAPLPLKVKIEAFFHLTSWVVYVLMVLLTVLVGPALYGRVVYGPPTSLWQWALEGVLFAVGAGSALLFYVVSQRSLNESWQRCIGYVPVLMAFGIGIAVNNAFAAVEGLLSRDSVFVRTPKFGGASTSLSRAMRATEVPPRMLIQGLLELALAAYLLAFALGMVLHSHWFERVWAATPFLITFIAGYAYIGGLTIAPLLRLKQRWTAPRPA